MKANDSRNMKVHKEKYKYTNPDEEVFFDEATNTFLLPFDATQQYALAYGLEHDLPIDVIAYPYISGDRMMAIVNNMPHGIEWSYMGNRFINRMDVYKIGQLDIDARRTELIMDAYNNFIKVIDIFDDVTKVSVDALELMYKAANVDRFNLINEKTTKHMKADYFNEHALTIYKRKKFFNRFVKFFDWLTTIKG